MKIAQNYGNFFVFQSFLLCFFRKILLIYKKLSKFTYLCKENANIRTAYFLAKLKQLLSRKNIFLVIVELKFSKVGNRN